MLKNQTESNYKVIFTYYTLCFCIDKDAPGICFVIGAIRNKLYLEVDLRNLYLICVAAFDGLPIPQTISGWGIAVEDFGISMSDTKFLAFDGPEVSLRIYINELKKLIDALEKQI